MILKVFTDDLRPPLLNICQLIVMGKRVASVP
jgi:hypothetical protein